MNGLYLKFYELKTRKIHENEFPIERFKSNKYVVHKDNFYILKNTFFIGSVDKKESFAFLRQEDEDIYIEKSEISSLMQNDIILIEHRNNQSFLKEILKRGLESIIVTVKKKNKKFFYYTDKPLNKKIIVSDEKNVTLGNVLNLEILKIEEKLIHTKIKNIIGSINDPDIEMKKIVAYHEWPVFNQDELERLAGKIKVNYNYEKTKRLNLTNKLIITIDGKDAKDLDDAISLEIINNNYLLGVHIADVSHFVQKSSLIDDAAFAKSTSVYMANKVIPMLPFKLSNDLCSLNANEEKLTLSCMILINKNGEVLNYEIKETIIKSSYRLTYDDVNNFLNKNKSLGDKKLDKLLLKMNEISEILKKIRKKRGEIEFRSDELKFIIDKNEKVVDVEIRKTNLAEALIESFMLIANETVAYHMEKMKLPSIYRIHEKPSEKKLEESFKKLNLLNIDYKKEEKNLNFKLQNILKNVRNSQNEYLVNSILLRSMSQAKYFEKPLGHFGLATLNYTHFTSPIRRYPDLILHRIIKDFLISKNYDKIEYYGKILSEVAKHTSTMERVSINIERDVVKLKSCEFLANKIGNIFEGQIMQIMKNGFFVQLKNGIEGFVNAKLNYDNYSYEPMLLGYKIKGHLYKLADKIEVKLIGVDMLTREIDFLIHKKKKVKINESNRKK